MNIPSKFLKTLLVFALLVLVWNNHQVFSQNTIRVQGDKIYSSCGEEIVMRGVNEMFVWSQDRTGERILPEIAKTGSNAVRLVWTTEGPENELDALINNSIKNKMVPVAELHDATGDFSKLQLLLDYWKKPAVLATIQKYKKWLIVNIGNEVGNGSESTAQWVNYYKDAITQLRDAGVDTPLMIDCGGYGNQERYFLEGGKELLEFDPLHNIIFAVHTYWTNGDDQAKIDRLNAMILDARQKELPYIIGEGPQKVASPVACGQGFPYKEMIKRLEEEKIGWLSWSWGAVDNNDCGAPNSELDITTDGVFGNWATTFAEEICVTDINSIQNTSVIPQSMINPGIPACGVTYTIVASADTGGSISPSGDVIVSENDNQIFDIKADRGFKIEDVVVDGSSLGEINTYTFSNVASDHTINVVFSAIPLPPQVPYVNGQPQSIPGQIKATSFDLGGEVVAYHDTTVGNEGDGIRQEEDVDTEFGGDGGNIGYTATGEWIEYTVDVVQAGTYTIDVLVASAVSTGAYHLEFDGIDVTGIQQVASTGGWTSYIPQKISNVTLNAGEQVMRIFIDGGSFNFSTMTFTKEGDTTNNPPVAAFTTSVTSGAAPLEVNFDASTSSDPDGDTLTYVWDFGNGQTATAVTPSMTFADPGTYTVMLTVDDGNGSTSKAEKIITVSNGDSRPAPVIPDQPSFTTDIYRNMFVESGRTTLEVSTRLDQIWNQFFVNGDVNSERLYYEVGNDMAYILDTGNNDIRSEGMSYGMMICVQLDKKEQFDKLWKFAKTHSQHQPGTTREGLFAWQLTTTGFSMIDQNPAPDGEEYFATALFFADAKWGSVSDGNFDPQTDVFDYRGQANYILDSMLNKPSSDSGQCPTDLVNLAEKQIVFTPCGTSATFTDPSYHLAGFYEIWALYADNNNTLWSEMADVSRTYLLPRAAHPVTGLMPDYSEFDGTPKNIGTHANFEFDAWRNIMNMGFDFAWFQKNKTSIQPLINRQIDFFKDKPNYPGLWTLDGTPRNTDHNPGLVACNAVGSLALEDAKIWPFVDELFELSIPSGQFRYYDGLLYMMSFMHLAGEFKIYKPDTNNQNPIASITSNVDGGVAPVTITFNGTGSTDPSGESLSYSWDFDNGETATTAITTTTYSSPGTYTVTLVVTNTSGQTDSITKTITVTDGNVSCAFGAPLATSLPSINASFENVFVLGNGGPNLDNVTKFEINWDAGNNGLYQLSMSTNDGSPNWWNDFLPKVTQNFNSPEPEITITDSGFSGLDGSYWATIDADNFVLVSKTGGFTIYFSTSIIAPNCDGGTTPTPVVDGGSISGGPFSFTVGDGLVDNVSGISLVGNTGANSQWVVTDDQNNILGLPATIESVDFDAAGTGTCLIWHLSYEDGLQGLVMNANINTLVGDFDFSNSISVFRNPASSGGGDCTFGTPLDSALPSINSAFENVFVLGDGGPDLSNIIKFEVNWDQTNNGFYQFSMNTSNGIPNWWNDLIPKVTHSFDTPQPSILITASGIPGLDGDYWVGLDVSNFVLVSKSKGFSIYFSTSSISPDCSNTTAVGIAATDVVISPNPAVNYIHVDISQDELQKHSGVTQLQLHLYTLTGLTITTKFIEERKQNIQTVIPVDGLESGIYILEIVDYKTNTQIRKKIIIHR